MNLVGAELASALDQELVMKKRIPNGYAQTTIVRHNSFEGRGKLYVVKTSARFVITTSARFLYQ